DQQCRQIGRGPQSVPNCPRRQRKNTLRTALSMGESFPRSDTGKYLVRVSDDCGTVASSPAILTLNRRLQIFTGSHTATLLWADPKAVLEQSDNAAGPWTEVAGQRAPSIQHLLVQQDSFECARLESCTNGLA